MSGQLLELFAALADEVQMAKIYFESGDADSAHVAMSRAHTLLLEVGLLVRNARS